jgi:hypothetical protein
VTIKHIGKNRTVVATILDMRATFGHAHVRSVARASSHRAAHVCPGHPAGAGIASVRRARRGGRAVECAGLENRRRAFRGEVPLGQARAGSSWLAGPNGERDGSPTFRPRGLDRAGLARASSVRAAQPRSETTSGESRL